LTQPFHRRGVFSSGNYSTNAHLLRKPIFQQNNFRSDTNDLKHIFISASRKYLNYRKTFAPSRY
jgi:hypothetical protein